MANKLIYFSKGESIPGTCLRVMDIKWGGMGIVYLCHDELGNTPIALKTFQLPSPEDWDYVLGSFIREARTWIAIGDARNVVQAHYVINVEVAGRIVPHLAIELIEGHEQHGASLAGWIRNHAITPEYVLLFAIHICSGMTEIQKKLAKLNIAFVHRDLKPQNILISHEGSIKITDFGLSRVLQDTAHNLRGFPPATFAPDGDSTFGMTATNICGTPPYMSPEQCLGQKTLDHRSDIYSFGCILYEMCTGHRVFIGTSVEEILRKHINDAPTSPRVYNPDLSDALISIIMRCLAKSPSDRYDSFKAINVELHPLLEQNGLGSGLLFWMCGFSAYTDTPRGKSDLNMSKETEALILERMQGIDYVIRLGLVKDKQEFDAIKSRELSGDKEERRKKTEQSKRKDQANELCRMGDSLYCLAASRKTDRVKLLTDALERYRSAQALFPMEPQIDFRLGMTCRDLGEVIKTQNRPYSNQLLVLAMDAFDSILRVMKEPVPTSIGETIYLLPFHAMYHRAVTHLVSNDTERAIRDFKDLATWLERPDLPKPKIRESIRQSTLRALDRLERQK